MNDFCMHPNCDNLAVPVNRYCRKHRKQTEVAILAKLKNPNDDTEWTAGTLAELLSFFSADTPIRVFCPFDGEGPEMWERLRIEVTEKGIRFMP